MIEKLTPWIIYAGVVAVSLVLGSILGSASHRTFGAWVVGRYQTISPQLWRSFLRPFQLAWLAVLLAVIPRIVSDESASFTHNTLRIQKILFIIVGALLLLRVIRVAGQLLESHWLTKWVNEPGRRSSAKTMLLLGRRAIHTAVIFTALGLVLIQFEVVRNVGVSLLASAGIAGIVLGLSAQKSISTLLSGLQLSIAQPIRIGDLVTIEGESGIVEGITLTYVTLKLGDERRLIVPISFFLDKAFKNSTVVSETLTGSVDFYIDYRAPIQMLYRELNQLIDGSSHWDRRSKRVMIENLGERNLVLRASVTAASAAELVELRYEILDKFIVYLQNLDQGKYLPHERIEKISS